MITVTTQSLSEMTDEAICYSLEHQLNLVDTFGANPQWEYTFPDRIALIGEQSRMFAAQIIGTVNGDSLWRWAWADPGLPDSAGRLAANARIYGTFHNIAAFTEPAVWVDTSTAILLSAAIKTISHRWTSFTFSPAPGWQVHAALTEPAITLPPATATSTAQVIGAAAELIWDVPRALSAYARQRELLALRRGKQVSIGRDRWRVDVQLGSHDQIVALHIDEDG
ncbi:DUF6882 domain-containing protein [Gordonia alkanivorans]|uniref:DUF6882 domain-containing protein n=1 Tax=Gordonia alkanivorans TaxID=84096 RepID=UPI0004B90C18|nr:DUF6882 domain-containing protein [Gordonia alkanivorans]